MGRFSDKKPQGRRAQLSHWFSASQAGDGQAVSELLEAYRPLLLSLANDGLDSDLRQKVAASDVVQNSLINATFGFRDSQFDSVQDVVAWLRQILTREIVRVYRRHRLAQKRDMRRERSMSSPEVRKWLEVMAISSADGEIFELYRQEEIERIQRAFGKLPPHYRKIIKWRMYDELTFAQIGIKKLHRSPDAARMLYERALKALEQKLAQ